MSGAACFTPEALLAFYARTGALEASCLWALALRPRPEAVSLAGYLGVFGLTCALELPFYAWALRGRSWVARVRDTALLNLATHPFIYFAVPRIAAALGARGADSVLVSEIFAPLVEAAILWRLRRGSFAASLAIAVLANLFSWRVGLWALA